MKSNDAASTKNSWGIHYTDVISHRSVINAENQKNQTNAERNK